MDRRSRHRSTACSLRWLLSSLPALSAAVLLLGGKRADKWGHLLGAARAGRAVRLQRRSCSSRSRARAADRERRACTCSTGSRSAASRSTSAC